MCNYKTGLREPPVSMLVIYKNICGVSVEWLATSEGEMFSDTAKAVGV